MRGIDYRIKCLYKEPVLILLALNALWVIIGYGIGTTLGMSAVAGFRIFKVSFLIVSFIHILYVNRASLNLILNKFSLYFIIVIVFVLSFFSESYLESIYKGITFIYPLLYIVYSINFLLKYGALNLLVYFSLIILLIYSLVPLSFLFFGGDLSSSSNIYGYTEGEFFVSNHYGWGSVLVILCSFTVLKYYPLNWYQRLILIGFLPYLFLLLLASANRSGLLSLIIAFVFFIVKDNMVESSKKIFLALSIFIIIMFVNANDNSAIDFIQNKNEEQIETGVEARLIGTNAILQAFDNRPVYWITGVGMFDYDLLKANGGILNNYHNSYWEILFGAGLIVFVLFVYIMVFYPLMIFLRFSLKYSYITIPLVIIPFFENNLTAGQFLFYPWFIFMILLNSKELNYYANKQIKVRGSI